MLFLLARYRNKFPCPLLFSRHHWMLSEIVRSAPRSIPESMNNEYKLSSQSSIPQHSTTLYSSVGHSLMYCSRTYSTLYKRSLLMSQFERIKKQYPDYILLFQVGDFYELYGDDASKNSLVCDCVVLSYLDLIERRLDIFNPLPIFVTFNEMPFNKISCTWIKYKGNAHSSHYLSASVFRVPQVHFLFLSLIIFVI